MRSPLAALNPAADQRDRDQNDNNNEADGVCVIVPVLYIRLFGGTITAIAN